MLWYAFSNADAEVASIVPAMHGACPRMSGVPYGGDVTGLFAQIGPLNVRLE